MSNALNVADMPQDFWSWQDTGKLVPLGICDGYDVAFERADQLAGVGCSHWVFSRAGLEEFQQELHRELPAAPTTHLVYKRN